MKTNNRNSIYDSLSTYDYLCNDKNKDIEVTEWTNGEGWDISIGERCISLTRGELDAINYLTKYLEYKSNENNN